MKIPHADRAVMEESKVRDYLLNLNHRRGDSKAQLLHLMGMTGRTGAVMTMPASDLRAPTTADRPSVRVLAHME